MKRFGVFSHSQRRLGQVAVVGVLGLATAFGLAACGGGGASQEEIAKAERHGRVYRMEQERKRRIEKELKELRKEQKNAVHTVPNPPPTTTSTPAPPAESSHSSCGGSLSVGPDTTCEFAENVRAEYESEIGSGSGTVYAYSPANNEFYEMFCTSAPHECSGAIDATVYFP